MNRASLIVLQELISRQNLTQRDLADQTDFSLGKVNQIIHELRDYQIIDNDNQLTQQGQAFVEKHHPRHAVILAAGYGMRMVPINTEQPKGLLEVHHQTLIERLIDQLHAVGVEQIDIVVGFMKEHFEFLADRDGINLIVNPHYHDRNNLYSLSLVPKEHLRDSYIIPSDIWFHDNPFHQYELYPWYMVSRVTSENQEWYSTKNHNFKKASAKHPGNIPVGLAYLTTDVAGSLNNQLKDDAQAAQHFNDFWEVALEESAWDQMSSRVIPDHDFAEINTYEQLLNLDANSNHLNTAAIDIITKVLKIKRQAIHHITVMKKGMTNRSFMFTVGAHRYIMRIPGAGTNKLINRRHEADVYHAIKSLGVAEPVLYINPANGYKLSRFIPNSRNSNAHDWYDVQRCMDLLRSIHQKKLKVNHQFDLFGQIDFYEKLRQGQPSAYRDYRQVKSAVLALRPFIRAHRDQWTLCHIDDNADNFLFAKEANGSESLHLIDWEYAGMQDPHLDIAMFAAYSMYDRSQVDQLIDCYFHNQCPETIRTKIYCYLAAAGLLWSNWCEYKQTLGLDFGEYSIAQYRFAKNYSQLAAERIKENQQND